MIKRPGWGLGDHFIRPSSELSSLVAFRRGGDGNSSHGRFRSGIRWLARPGRSAMPCYLVTSSPAVLLAALGSAGLCPLGNPGACHSIPILPRYDFIVSSPHQPPPPSAGHGSLPPRPNAVGMPPPQGSTAASSLAQRFQQYGYWHAKFQFQAIKQYN